MDRRNQLVRPHRGHQTKKEENWRPPSACLLISTYNYFPLGHQSNHKKKTRQEWCRWKYSELTKNLWKETKETQKCIISDCNRVVLDKVLETKKQKTEIELLVADEVYCYRTQKGRPRNVVVLHCFKSGVLRKQLAVLCQDLSRQLGLSKAAVTVEFALACCHFHRFDTVESHQQDTKSNKTWWLSLSILMSVSCFSKFPLFQPMR